MNNYADEIKGRVPLLDLLALYGFHPVFNRMPCPFHNGKDRNMLVSNNFYKCFVCGESGDIFTFVQRYFGLDFNAACAKINDDFRLGLPIGKVLPRAEQEEAAKREAERRRKAEERKRRHEALEKKWRDALTEFAMCDTIIQRCQPISPTTGFSDVFCWAVHNIDRAYAEMTEAQAKLFLFRQEEKI